MFYKRHVSHLIIKALKRAPAIFIGGASQIGKTTIAPKIVSHDDYSYTTLDTVRDLANAKDNPDGFIDSLISRFLTSEIMHSF